MKEAVEFHNAVIWGKTAETASAYLDTVLRTVISVTHKIQSHILLFVAETVRWAWYGGA